MIFEVLVLLFQAFKKDIENHLNNLLDVRSDTIIYCLLNVLCNLHRYLWMNEFSFQADTKSIVQTQRRLVKPDKTERFTTALEVESQGYKHF